MVHNDIFIGKSIEIIGEGVHESHYSEKKTDFCKQLFAEEFLKNLMPYSIDKKGYALVIPNETGILYFAGVKADKEVDGFESYEISETQYDFSTKKGGLSRNLFDQLEDDFFNDPVKKSTYVNKPILEILLNGNPNDAEVELWVPIA